VISWRLNSVILTSLALVTVAHAQAPAPTPPPRVTGGAAIPHQTAPSDLLRRRTEGAKPGTPDFAKAAARQVFAKNFRELQLLGYELLREHEAGQLQPPHLAKEAKSIHKRAKTLRSLLELGEHQSSPTEIIGSLATPQEFDSSIRRLSRLIYSFAHNPVHQSGKVFNTTEAARARTDLATIITLSKVIESKAKSYVAVSASAH